MTTNKEWRCVQADLVLTTSGLKLLREVGVGDYHTWKDFRTGEMVTGIVESLEPPHREGTNGRVTIDGMRMYAKVFDLKFIPQAVINEVNEYLKDMAARGFVPQQATIDQLLRGEGVQL